MRGVGGEGVYEPQHAWRGNKNKLETLPRISAHRDSSASGRRG